MLNMQAFHKLLSTASEKKDAYLNALTAITKIHPNQLDVMGNNLSWEDWGTTNTQPVKA